MENMEISEPQNMVPRILGIVEKWFQDFQVPFFTVLGVPFPAKYGTGSSDPISRVPPSQF